jgi:hypothetical protein
MRVQVAILATLVAFSSGSTTFSDGEALRLTVNGSKLLDPAGSEIHLTGMNFVPSHWHEVIFLPNVKLLPSVSSSYADDP